MGFSRQEYGSGLPCLPVGDLSDPGIETVSLISAALAGIFFTTGATWEAPVKRYFQKILFVWAGSWLRPRGPLTFIEGYLVVACRI